MSVMINMAFPFLGPLFATLIIMLRLPILARLTMQAMRSTSASITATIFSLKNKNAGDLGSMEVLVLTDKP